MRAPLRHKIFQLALIPIFLPSLCFGQGEPQLSAEQQREFLLKAKVLQSKKLNVGITRSFRLILSYGGITHYAHFQSINERHNYKELERGGEANFVDSYLYNIAAYELAKLIGLDEMLPVTVQRKWEGKSGAMAWWLSTQMDLGQMKEKKISPPDPEAWSNAMHKVEVFTELIYDTDRYNPGNIKIGHNWELYMIDFTRSFRLYHDIRPPQNLVRCSRQLLEKLRALDGKLLTAGVGKYLNKLEINGVIKRRDKIVAHFEKLIAENGEQAVLY